MDSDKHSGLNSQITEEAAQWLVEFRSGPVDVSDRRAFDAWVRASPQHLWAFIEMAILWNDVTSVDPERRIVIEDLVAGAGSESNVVALERAAEPPAPAHSPARHATRWGPGRIAVAASILVGVTGVLLLAWSRLREPPVYATSVGEQRSISLADGSRVTLNARSRLRVEFTSATRRVELLDGQAFFHVAKNPARPFVVLSDDTAVRAVGTQFDVNRSLEGTTVTVLEGRVAVYSEQRDDAARQAMTGKARAGDALREESVLLAAGEQLQVMDPNHLRQPVHIDANSATAWRQGRIVLEAATLAQIAVEFNRYSAREFTAEDHGASPLRLSGVFATDPDFLINYLRERPDITVTETDTGVRIVREAAR
jgi:transmembrane sensor